VSSDDRKHLIFLEEILGKLSSKEVRAPSDIVDLGYTFTVTRLVINRVSPDNITKQSSFGDLSEPINLLDVIQLRFMMLTDLSYGDTPP
jgi:hypothetical protein